MNLQKPKGKKRKSTTKAALKQLMPYISMVLAIIAAFCIAFLMKKNSSKIQPPTSVVVVETESTRAEETSGKDSKDEPESKTADASLKDTEETSAEEKTAQSNNDLEETSGLDEEEITETETTEEETSELVTETTEVQTVEVTTEVLAVPAVSDVLPTFDDYTKWFSANLLKSDALKLHSLLQNPGTYGVNEEEAVLPDYSPAGIEAQYVLTAQARSLLDGYDYATLSASQKNTYNVLMDYLTARVSGVNLSIYEEPLSLNDGYQVSLIKDLALYSFRSTADVERYLKLIESVPDSIDQVLEFEEKKADNGVFMGDVTAGRVISQCQEVVDKPDVLYSTFETRLKALDLDETTEKQYIQKNQLTVNTYLLVGYKKLISGLNSLKGKGKNNGGLCNYTQGKEYYDYLVSSQIGSYRSVEELKTMIESEMLTQFQIVHTMQTMDSFILDVLNKAPIPNECSECLSQVREYAEETYPKLDMNIALQPIDANLAPYVGEIYFVPAPLDSKETSIIYSDASDTSAGSTYAAMAEHVVPGSAYRLIYGRSQSDAALLNLVACTGYTKGWDLYAQLDSYEKNTAISDQVRNYLEASFRLYQAVYARIDIGIHYDGWTQSDVARALSGYYGQDYAAASKELYQDIIGNPGKYLAPEAGYLEISLQKQTAESTWNDYSETIFNQAVLNIGPAPLSMIRDRVAAGM